MLQRQQEGQLLPETVVWQVLWEVAQGLEFLHAHEVIVMDIKPDNVFCNRNGTFQIGDFGLAVVGSTQRVSEYLPAMTWHACSNCEQCICFVQASVYA